MFTRLKIIKDKCPFFYKTHAKKNDDIINPDDHGDADDNDGDTKSQELQFLLERCDLDSEKSTTPNYAKNILDKISSFLINIKPTIVSGISK